MDENIRELCRKHTNLTGEDVAVLETVASQLPNISDLTGNDIFIDALTINEIDSVVLAWASPQKSLYRTSVVGQLAYSTSEPAVYHTIKTGEISRDIRGVSQEGVPISQTVVPIRNPVGRVIGVLIREQDISKELRQEEQVQYLGQTVETLSSTLMYLSRTESTFEEWLSNGIFILDKDGKIKYANKNAITLYKNHFGAEPLGNDFAMLVPERYSLSSFLAHFKGTQELSLNNKWYCFQTYPLITQGELSGCAVSVQDITDLRKKERELNAKSIIIREIHHRVKNNLQNIAALLRLQMRRSREEYVKREFAACINRIMAIALVHDVSAYSTWESIDLIELTERILSGIMEQAVMPGHGIETRVEGEHVRLPGRQSVSLALVINELVSNAVKHGVGPQNKGRIIVSIKEEKESIILTVSDNGPHLPEDFDFRSATRNRLGLQIVDSLVREQLGGFFSLERSGEYTRALVKFPKPVSEVEP